MKKTRQRNRFFIETITRVLDRVLEACLFAAGLPPRSWSSTRTAASWASGERLPKTGAFRARPRMRPATCLRKANLGRKQHSSTPAPLGSWSATALAASLSVAAPRIQETTIGCPLARVSGPTPPRLPQTWERSPHPGPQSVRRGTPPPRTPSAAAVERSRGVERSEAASERLCTTVVSGSTTFPDES